MPTEFEDLRDPKSHLFSPMTCHPTIKFFPTTFLTSNQPDLISYQCLIFINQEISEIWHFEDLLWTLTVLEDVLKHKHSGAISIGKYYYEINI